MSHPIHKVTGFRIVGPHRLHVEFADGAQRARNLAHLPREAADAIAVRQQRQRFADAARRDARLVQRVLVAPRRIGQRGFQDAQALTYEMFPGG